MGRREHSISTRRPSHRLRLERPVGTGAPSLIAIQETLQVLEFSATTGWGMIV